MMKIAMAILACTLVWTTSARADYSVIYYELGSGRSKKLFTSEHKLETKDGNESVFTNFSDLDGKPLYQEKVTLSGLDLKKVEIDQKQTGKTGVVELKDGKVFFSTKQGDKTKEANESIGKTFVMSGNFQRFIKSQWPDILAGKSVDFRFAAWERLETIGFSVKKEKESEVQGQKTVTIKMKPSSFLIAALVNPLYFTFAADGSKLVEMSGRLPIKQKSGDDFKDLDGEAVYTYIN